MAEMTPERSRKIGRRWSLAAIVLTGLPIPLGMLGFDEFRMPLILFALVCFYAAGEKSGWVDGWEAAKASNSDNFSVSGRDSGRTEPASNKKDADV